MSRNLAQKIIFNTVFILLYNFRNKKEKFSRCNLLLDFISIESEI